MTPVHKSFIFPGRLSSFFCPTKLVRTFIPGLNNHPTNMLKKCSVGPCNVLRLFPGVIPQLLKPCNWPISAHPGNPWSANGYARKGGRAKIAWSHSSVRRCSGVQRWLQDMMSPFHTQVSVESIYIYIFIGKLLALVGAHHHIVWVKSACYRRTFVQGCWEFSHLIHQTWLWWSLMAGVLTWAFPDSPLQWQGMIGNL